MTWICFDNVEKKQLGALVRRVNKSKLNISYETLEKAANYFNNSNKLGQGGSGSVYKVILFERYFRFSYSNDFCLMIVMFIMK